MLYVSNLPMNPGSIHVTQSRANSMRMKCPSSDVDASLSVPTCVRVFGGMSSDSSENDPTMINRSTLWHRSEKKKVTRPIVVDMILPQPMSSPSKKNRLKSGSPCLLPTTQINQPGPGRTPGIAGSGALTFRTLNSKIHNFCRRMDTAMSSIGVDGVHECIQLPVNAAEASPKSSSMMHTTSYWKQASVPSSTQTCSTGSSLTTVDSYMTTECENYSRVKKSRRRVRFNEALNVTVDSELSSLDIKEHRKQMWWSSKDRIRSLKQRHFDLKTIMKQNQSERTGNETKTTTLALVQEPSDEADSIATTTTSAKDAGTVSSNDEANTAMILSDYCQAVVTLYIYCHEQCAKSKEATMSNATTAPTNDHHPIITFQRLNRKIRHSIHVIVTSKYRGLERIVCKILQMQNESQLASVLLHDDAIHSIPQSSSISCHPHTLPLRIDNILAADTATTATIIAHDTTIEVISSNSTANYDGAQFPDTSSEGQTIITVTASKPTITTKTSPMCNLEFPQQLFMELPSSNTVATTMLIRKSVVEYQTQLLRRHDSTTTYGNYPIDRHDNDDDDTISSNIFPVNDTLSLAMLEDNYQPTHTLYPQLKQQEQRLLPQPPVLEVNIGAELLLSNHYRSFPAHHVSIVWAQLMALGDASLQELLRARSMQ